VRWMVLLLGLVVSAAVAAQELPKKKKKPAQKSALKAHQKPTPEQIRRFNELEKKK